jgi:hypothetical protein
VHNVTAEEMPDNNQARLRVHGVRLSAHRAALSEFGKNPAQEVTPPGHAAEADRTRAKSFTLAFPDDI